MSSKWIAEVKEKYEENDDRDFVWNNMIYPILIRIDRLLRLALLDTDNNYLYNKIRKEITKDY